jgi:hypothetical protein
MATGPLPDEHEAMSCGRMLESETKLAGEVEAWPRRAEQVNHEKGARQGVLGVER